MSRPHAEVPATDADTGERVSVIFEHALDSLFHIEVTVGDRTVLCDYRDFMRAFNSMMEQWDRLPYIQKMRTP